MADIAHSPNVFTRSSQWKCAAVRGLRTLGFCRPNMQQYDGMNILYIVIVIHIPSNELPASIRLQDEINREFDLATWLRMFKFT